MGTERPTIRGVHLAEAHTFTKESVSSVELLAGIGVRGDAHAGARVRHRSRVAANPEQPNLRQVHLIHVELFQLLAEQGHRVRPGDLGENITTAGIELLALPVGTVLSLGEGAVVALTGLRNPCHQIDGFQDGLLGAVRPRGADGAIVRLAGVMAVVLRGGIVRPGDRIGVSQPPEPHHRLEPV